MKLLVFLIICILFNISYFSNTGLLIFGLKRAQKITFKNALKFYKPNDGPLSLSTFRMEQFMSEDKCNILSEQILKDPQLKRRNAAMSTLGTASYLDGSNKDLYVKLSSKTNPHLKENYSKLLNDILKYFRSKTSANVEFRKNAALPGFHVFDCNNLFAMPVASVHKDMQFLRLKMEEDECFDTENTMSFTLSLQLPPGGGGLYTFDSLEVPVLHHLIPRPIIHSIAPKKKIEYKVGWIVTHEGQTYHMIAPCKASQKHRITLQGHGVYDKNKNVWWLYW